jgi:hypothetical protein
MNRTWSESDREYIRANAGVLTDEVIAANLTRITGRPISLQAARKQRQLMGLRKRHGRGICKLVADQPSIRYMPKRPLGVPITIEGASPPEQGSGE